MTGIFSKRFSGPTQLTTTKTTQFTVPTGHTYVVKTIIANNEGSPNAAIVRVFLSTPAGPGKAVTSFYLPAGTCRIEELHLALTGGDFIAASETGGAGALAMLTLSGFDFVP